MGVTIPQPFVSSIEGPIGPVTVDGIPDTFHIDIDTLPKILLGVDPITLNPVSATITLTPVQVGLSIDRFPTSGPTCRQISASGSPCSAWSFSVSTSVARLS